MHTIGMKTNAIKQLVNVFNMVHRRVPGCRLSGCQVIRVNLPGWKDARVRQMPGWKVIRVESYQGPFTRVPTS